MATVAERVSVLETKVDNFAEKMDDVKADISSNQHTLLETLKEMREASTTQHSQMADKIKDLEGFRNKWVKYGMVGLAFAAGAGWIGNPNMATLLKFFGI
jgi:N-acetylglutamate synthase/N-acetylornithine aminotransferase